jgi:hypothetical protein
MSVFAALLQCPNDDDLKTVFKQTVESLDVEQLGLQQAVKNGSIALPEDISFMVLSTQQSEQQFIVKCGIFFRSMIAGCSCADDPSPSDTLEEYSEAWFVIEKRDGSFVIKFD